MRNHSFKNNYDLRENETACTAHFHVKGFALRLVLKQRHMRTRKWRNRQVVKSLVKVMNGEIFSSLVVILKENNLFFKN